AAWASLALAARTTSERRCVMRGALGAASGCPAGSPEGAALAFWSWWTAAPSSAEEPKALLMAGSGAGTAVALLRRASEASVAPRFPAVAELRSASSAERVLAAVGDNCFVV
ncbi:unnamed protein product, partial [Polarella glacialis]